MSRTLTFTLNVEQKSKAFDNNTRLEVIETEEQALQRLKDRISKLDSLLSNMCSFKHYGIREWHRINEPFTTGYTIEYFVHGKNKGVKWNDIYKTVNDTGHAVSFKFLK